MKPISAALTTKELDCLDSISSLFQRKPPLAPPHILKEKEGEVMVQNNLEDDHERSLDQVIQSAR
jgi:hypothetical protein